MKVKVTIATEDGEVLSQTLIESAYGDSPGMEERFLQLRLDRDVRKAIYDSPHLILIED